MLFNKEKYYNAIVSLETRIIIKSFFIIFICTILSMILSTTFRTDKLITILIGLIIGSIIAYMYYTTNQIKIEEMKMKFDIYNKIIQQKE